MHLNLRLPVVQLESNQPPKCCPYPDRRHRKQPCRGTHFKVHQTNCPKPLRDTHHSQVYVRRYRCPTCQRTFRVYPSRVCAAQQSATLKGLSVLLYFLGLCNHDIVRGFYSVT